MKTTLLTLASLAIMQAATLPTEGELDAALDQARIAWGVDTSDPVRIILEPLNACHLKDTPQIAITQRYWSVTTMTFDADEPPITSKQNTFVIRVNSSCDWSKLNLTNTIIHEYGHILIGDAYHSKDRHSVMFYVVASDGEQSILPADRALLASR